VSTARVVALSGANQALSGTQAVYAGYSIRETAGAAARVRIWDNASAASGTILETIGLTGLASSWSWLGPEGLWAVNGIFVEVVAGTVEGSIRIG